MIPILKITEGFSGFEVAFALLRRSFGLILWQVVKGNVALLAALVGEVNFTKAISFDNARAEIGAL